MPWKPPEFLRELGVRLATLGHDFMVKPVVHDTGLSASTLYSHYIVSIFFPYMPKTYIK